MQRRGNGAKLILIIVVAIAAASCTAEGGADQPAEERLVTVFGSFRGVSAERFRASMEPFEEETGITVRYVGTTGFASTLEERIEESDLPDIALLPQPALMKDLAEQEWLVPLPDSVRADAQRSLHPEAFDLGLIGGDYFGIMYRSNVKSLVWYPPVFFADLGYEVPTTFEELLELVRQMDSDGIRPWCIGLEASTASGWPGTDFIEDLVLRALDPEDFDEWAAGAIPFTDARIQTAFELLEAMTRGRTLGGSRAALSITTARAQDPMFDTPPKCLLHRQASFHVDNLPDGTVVGPEGDTDIFVFPAMDPSQPNPVLSGGDMAAAFNDDPDTIALMGYLADRRSGEAWARAGGFLSPHDEFDVDIYGTDYDRRVAEILAAAEIIRFDASDQMIPPVGTRSFLEAVLHLFRTGDVRESVEIAQSGYPND